MNYKKEFDMVVNKMVRSIKEKIKEKNLTLKDFDFSSSNAFLESIDNNLDQSGEIRCENFCDIAWQYAENFGELESPKFEESKWLCIDAAIELLKKELN